MYRWSVMLLWLLLVSATRLWAQKAEGLSAVRVLSSSVSVRAWTVEQGLPQSTVTEMGTDARGYLWGATFGGLFRFDGRAMIAYSSSELPILTSNAVTALYSRGNELWIGTPQGTIARLRDGVLVDTLPHAPQDQASRGIDNLLSPRSGELWLREGTDVHRYVDGRWQARLPFRSLSALVRDAAGNVFFYGEDGLVRVDARGETTVLAKPANDYQFVPAALHLGPGERIWLGLQSGLWLYERGAIRRVHRSAAVVAAVVADSTGDLWFSDGSLLLRYRQPEIGAASDIVPVLDAGTRITSLASLHDGSLAVGSHEGLLIVRLNASRLVTDQRTLPGVEVGSLASRGDGTVFLTSECGAVLHMDRQARVLHRIPRPDTIGCSRSLLVDRRGRLWIGGDGAIRRVTMPGTEQARDTVFRVSRYHETAPEVQVLLERADTIMLGLSDGRVGRVGPDDRLAFIPGFGIPTDVPVHSLASDREGNLWVAQAGMMTRVRGAQLSIFHALHGVPNAVPRALLPDDRGGVWIGTYGSGLWHLRTGGTAHARPVPLPDRTVSSIIDDGAGRVWMSGNRGISVVRASALRDWIVDSSVVPGVRLLSVAEGVPEGNNGRPAATRLSPDHLAFASVKGLVEINDRQVLTNGVTPPIRIDSVRSNSGRVLPGDSLLVLEPDERIIQIGFSTPSFLFADAIRFRYRVEGRDEGWVNLGSSREFRLVRLEPGTYSLVIEGRVPGGEWRRAAPLALEVVPRFVELWWPPVLAAAMLLGLVGLVLLQRVRASRATARAREIELQARRDAAESAARYQREVAQVGRVAVAGELTASLSHELGQPLAAIVNNAEVARRLLQRESAGGQPAPPVVEQALLDVVAQGRRASQVIREFRRFLKREHGDREVIRMQELLESVTVLLRQEFDQSKVRLHVQVDDDTPLLFAERVLLQQVLVNLLQNAHEAARHGGRGEVLVRARPVSGGVRISVVDNGSGFPPAVRRSAFEPFVTTRTDGMGMGLAITRRVVESHGGHIAVGRLPAAGAVVSLWLPARYVPVDASDSLVPLQVTTHA